MSYIQILMCITVILVLTFKYHICGMLAFMLNLNQLLSASKFLRPAAMQLKICSDQIRKLVEDKFQISVMLGLQLRGEGGLHSMREQITDVSIFFPDQWSPKGKLIFSLFYLKFFLHIYIYIYLYDFTIFNELYQ